MTCPDCHVTTGGINDYDVELCDRHAAVDELIEALKHYANRDHWQFVTTYSNLPTVTGYARRQVATSFVTSSDYGYEVAETALRKAGER